MGFCSVRGIERNTMKGETYEEERNKGIEATKQEYMSRRQTGNTCPWDACVEKGSSPVKADKAAKP